uniref:CACTA en-spm transposon protein n=1 Tax=Elaeophora elaphi TaxID=1147741 RepID=A0A0R3RI66_9BILA
MDTLKSFNTRNIPFDKKRHSQDNGSGTVASKRPKLEGDAWDVRSEMQCVAEQNNDKSYTSALLPFPVTQPTHTGYIISATLLPSLP